VRDEPATWRRPVEAVTWFVTGRTWRTAAPTAALVGTILSAVNQGAVMLDGQATAMTCVRIAVNYLVPYCVASIGYLAARRAR
jgi:hypothetical protein